MSYLIEEESKLNSSTPDGIYNIKLSLTGDEKAARAAATEAYRQLLEARVGSSTMPSTV